MSDASTLSPVARCLESRGSDKRRKTNFKTTDETRSSTDRWRRIAAGAQRIVVPSAAAEEFVLSVLPQRAFDRIDRAYKERHAAKRKRRKATNSHLGLVPVRSCSQEQRLMAEIARLLANVRPDISITIIGVTLDDIGLMRTGNAFVTGAVDPKEFKDLVHALGIDSLFVSATRPIFAHPVLLLPFHPNCQLPILIGRWADACRTRAISRLILGYRSAS